MGEGPGPWSLRLGTHILAWNTANTMDAKWVNLHCRNYLGFFLTSSADAKDELDVLHQVTALVFDYFKEHKIRSGNVLENLDHIEAIADRAGDLIAAMRHVKGWPKDDAKLGAKALAYAIIYSILGTYYTKSKRRGPEKPAPKKTKDE